MSILAFLAAIVASSIITFTLPALISHGFERITIFTLTTIMLYLPIRDWFKEMQGK